MKSDVLPRWDLTSEFSAPDGADFRAAVQECVGGIDEVQALFDQHAVEAGPPIDVTDTIASAIGEVLDAFNDVRERFRYVSAYVAALVTIDSRDEVSQAAASGLQRHGVALSVLRTRLTQWVGRMEVEQLIARSAVAEAHAFALRRTARAAKHLMAGPAEDVVSELTPSGPTAWAKLHGDITSQLMVDVALADGVRRMPMSSVRGLASDPDPQVRQSAYVAEIEAWKTVEVPLSAALNSIKGWSNVTNQRRGWADELEPALFDNNIDRATLDAMQSAVTDSFAHFRRYLHAKAKLLNKPRCAWWDLMAPVAQGADEWTFNQAAEFIVDRFATYSDRLASMARRSFDEVWIDAEPRDGKRDGAYCMKLSGERSLVMANFTGSFNSVSTLAHELGHAYHNVNLAHRTPLQSETPMALAETASIFCQTIVGEAMIAEADDSAKLAILEDELHWATQIVVDIHSRFLFERAVFAGRRERELSVSELNAAMLEAQRATYGDGLDSDVLHPYMWAVKGHYYSAGRSFYNWPYTFGLLFGLGLYARYRQEGESFTDRYDDLLSSTGLQDAVGLGQRFGIDFTSTQFWADSLSVLAERVDTFVELAEKGQQNQ